MRYLTVFIKLALTAAVLLAIAWKFDFSGAVRLLATISAGAIVGCLLLLLCQAWVAGARLSRLMTMFGHKLDIMTSSRLTLQAAFFNQAFVSFLGGDAFKIWRIHRIQVPLADATSAVVLDRVVGFIVNHFAFVALLPLVYGRIESAAVRWSLLALAAAGLAGIAVLLLLGILGRRLAPIDLLPARWRASRVAALLVDLTTIGRHIVLNPGAACYVGALSLLIALNNCLLFYIILRSWNVAAELAFKCALLAPGIMEIALLPLSVAGWGMREGAAIIGLGAMGLNSETGLAVSVAFGLLNLAVGLLGGLLWLFDRSTRNAAAVQ